MAAIGKSKRETTHPRYAPYNVVIDPGARYLLCMGRISEHGGREIYFKSFPDGKWLEATKEAWTHAERGYMHMDMIDLFSMSVRESGHVTDAQGSWLWEPWHVRRSGVLADATVIPASA